MNEIVFLILGLIGLWWGSDFAVEAARRIAVKLRVSDLIIGLTITSIGTSLPEISTNIMAGFSTLAEKDASGIAVGNIIGSDLVQITLLLGIVGFLATLTIPMRSLKRDGFMLFLSLMLMYITAVDGYVSQGEGILLVLVYVVYIIYLLNGERVLGNRKTESKRNYRIGVDLVKTFIGLVVVVVGAYLIVENGVVIALQMRIDESIIGIFVGLGTSIPELTVSLRAIKKGAGELSLGNLIGSNITDPLLSFGLGASVAGVTISLNVLQFDFVYWMAATAIALFLLYNHMNLNRKESSVLIILYLLFIYLKITFFLAG